MSIFLKYKSKLIFFLTFIIVILTIIAIIFDFVAVYKKYEVNENIKSILEKARNIYSILEEAQGNINEDVLKSLKEIRAIEFK